jgi:hypothetical protein
MVNLKKITTSNKELYRKLNQLHIVNEVILNNIKPIQIQRILNRINTTDNVLSMEKIGSYFLLRKHKPLQFDIYHRHK